ncbi:MAG: hypothetical protein KUG75_14215 [Pseudomonadales bacterium]|nr:hypothetical protein [Pseudomonadales bacterium]
MPAITSKQQYWSEQLQQADAYDGSLAEYAQALNIPAQTLYRWRSYFKQSTAGKDKTKALFTQIITSPTPDACVKLQVGKVRIQFVRLPDPQWLAAFITTSNET